jgi:helix-turn-helix protein
MNERPDIRQIKAQLAAELLQLADVGDASGGEAVACADSLRIDLDRVRRGDLEHVSIEDLVALLNALDRRVTVTISPAAYGDGRSLMEKIAAITAAIPMQEWDKLPSDLAQNHDHYLYGAPKHG